VGGFSYSSLAKELVAIAMKLFIQLFSSTTSSRGEKKTHTHTHTHDNGIGGRVTNLIFIIETRGVLHCFFLHMDHGKLKYIICFHCPPPVVLLEIMAAHTPMRLLFSIFEL